MKKPPTSITAGKNHLKHAKAEASQEIRNAIQAASDALDQQSQEIVALRRIIIGERAQVIYYSEKYRATIARECVELVAVGYLDLPEELQEKFVKQAIVELNCNEALSPHDAEGAKAKLATAETGKKLIIL
jgi:5,10-methylene-tetrahydrofolate dehydrogenase/methenyl tetrahydrofolate cyclohydrolase